MIIFMLGLLSYLSLLGVLSNVNTRCNVLRARAQLLFSLHPTAHHPTPLLNPSTHKTLTFQLCLV